MKKLVAKIRLLQKCDKFYFLIFLKTVKKNVKFSTMIFNSSEMGQKSGQKRQNEQQAETLLASACCHEEIN